MYRDDSFVGAKWRAQLIRVMLQLKTVAKARLAAVQKLVRIYIFPHAFGHRHTEGWKELIADKSVAIVGPAPLVSSDQSAEIETHDVIVRVGHEHWAADADPGRTTVWVLDGTASREFLDGHLEPKDADWVLLKGPVRLRDFRRPTTKYRRVRCVRRRLPPEMAVPWRWHPNQVPLVAMELSHMRPSAVRVFGSDFYTTPNQAYGAHSPVGQSNLQWTEFAARMFRSHDQLHQKKVLLHLHERYDLFRGDSRFMRLISMPEAEFAALLQAEPLTD